MTHQEEDNELIWLVAQGDKPAIAALYDRWASNLIGMGLQFIRQREEVEDVVHDVFLEIWRTAADFDPSRGSARTWIVMKMRCRLLDKLRRAQRRNRLLDEHGQLLHPSAQTSPHDKSAHHELHRLIDTLHESLREVIVMVYFQGLSSTEVALAMDLPIGTVKSRLARARRELQTLYEDGVQP